MTTMNNEQELVCDEQFIESLAESLVQTESLTLNERIYENTVDLHTSFTKCVISAPSAKTPAFR